MTTKMTIESDAPAPSKPLFLHIPTGRLIILSIVSLGLYQCYWIYKNWRYVKERDGLKIWPFWRGIFGIFFIHDILKTIRNDEQNNRLEQATFSAGGLATGWLTLVVFGNLMSRVDDVGLNLLGVLISLPSFCFLIPVQNYINRVNSKLNPKPPYTPWSAGHTVCLVLGIVLWLLMLADIMLPE